MSNKNSFIEAPSLKVLNKNSISSIKIISECGSGGKDVLSRISMNNKDYFDECMSVQSYNDFIKKLNQ